MDEQRHFRYVSRLITLKNVQSLGVKVFVSLKVSFLNEKMFCQMENLCKFEFSGSFSFSGALIVTFPTIYSHHLLLFYDTFLQFHSDFPGP